MEQKEKQEKQGQSLVRFLFHGFFLLVGSLVFGRRDARPPGGAIEIDEEQRLRRLVFNGWLIVCGMAVAFALYGMFAFFVIGDKGPPGWDFGGVQDVPGGSEYSTHPFRDVAAETEPQHVNQKPSDAMPYVIGPPPTAGKLFEGEMHEGPGKGAMRGEYGPGT